ncbi:MAG TPA: NADH-quinone oxidoreductase subunit NuoG [Eoetvoesiella sp.]|jgi:NADH-quinone oxidoreductase subunit G|uniref:NADH-quinone oxidoreductase subunit NuoG n=1 Tax=Eoetvoesiella sp. TaxID=1966355 RepID=UPI002BA9C2E6|nr:NADH-quinone oxidoreductase subunit NuoG [Eoetvoesiella sp.]HWK61165.1 NADH-quinone oxidoreductase subunit NuoG [Eoetvoesiella sp.]
MVELTIDGKKVEVPEGSMVMQAAHKLGLYVPHFCYHKKLSIAANCRMCLVEVEKAPKAMPACATPVTNGMIVHTASAKAVAAQKSVMEFLLINHPLDCPVCDQGGECQLQDLAVGYGASASRYQEEKRVVFHKEMGPLVSAEEMQRCIHCTRCVRFGQEVGGIMELGMVNRGEHSEITSFVGRAVESELSGNMIDICPVGALTSKPFRYTARTWELARRRSVSPHDSVGANLVVQVKGDRVMRVVPFENEDVNECWISDRDRYAYTGLYTEDRLAHPMIRTADGQWREASWSDALQAVVKGLNQVRDQHGATQIGALGTQEATLEELALLARLTRSLGSENVDFRLRQTDAGLDKAVAGVPWLGMPIAELGKLDRVLVVGSFLRKDHPLFAQRLRQAAKHGTQISFIDCGADDPLFPVQGRLTVTPGALPNAVAEVLVALAQATEQTVPDAFGAQEPSEEAKRIAASLASGENVAVLLGNLAVASPQASLIAANAQALAQAAKGRLGFLTAGGNTVGGYVAGATPRADGLTAAQMLADGLKAYIVLHAEPALDADNGAQALQALQAAEFTVALTSYRSAAQDWAHVMLPVSPFTETSGTFINAEGRAQSFKGAAAPFVDTRPAWKVLRVLGNLFELPGFDDETSESIRDSVLVGGVEAHLSNDVQSAIGLAAAPAGLERVADVPIYRSDAMVRRAEPLQQTAASQAPQARMCAATLASLGVESGRTVRVRSPQGEITVTALLDNAVAQGAVRLSAAFAETLPLGGAFGQLSVEGV